MQKRDFIVSVFGDGDKETCHLDKVLFMREVCAAHTSNFVCCPEVSSFFCRFFCLFICSPSTGQDKKTNTLTTVQHSYTCNTIYCVYFFQLKPLFEA